MKFVKADVSWIAIALSIITFVAMCFRVEPMKADWMAILVGILAMLVTVLIGWQIFSVFNFKNEKDNFSREMNQIRESFTRDRMIITDSLLQFFIKMNKDYEVIVYCTDLIRMNTNNDIKNVYLKALSEYLSKGDVLFEFNFQADEALSLLISLKPIFVNNKEEIQNLEQVIQKIKNTKAQ